MQSQAGCPGPAHLPLGSAVMWAAHAPILHPGTALGERLGEMRFSLSLFPDLFPRGEMGPSRLGPALELVLGRVGHMKPGPGDNSIQRSRVGHDVWAAESFPGIVLKGTGA